MFTDQIVNAFFFLFFLKSTFHFAATCWSNFRAWNGGSSCLLFSYCMKVKWIYFVWKHFKIVLMF